MARNYAAVPHEYLQEMELISDAEFGRLIRALLLYSSTGEVPPLSGSERVLFPRVRMQEDRFQQSYRELEESRTCKAQKAAQARWSKNQQSQSMLEDAQACTSMHKDAPNANTKTETETNTLPTIVGESRGRQSRFRTPTVEQVADYCAQRGNQVDPQRFVDYYASNGWKVGKNPMKDWKAAVRTWEKNGYSTIQPRQSGKREKSFTEVLAEAEKGGF